MKEQQTVEMITIDGSSLYLGESQTAKDNSIMDISFTTQNPSFVHSKRFLVHEADYATLREHFHPVHLDPNPHAQSHAGPHYEFVDVIESRISSCLSSPVGSSWRLEFNLAVSCGRWVDYVDDKLDRLSTRPSYL